MKNCLIIALVCCVFSCKPKKADLAGDAPVKVNDFIAAFKPLVLPYAVADTNLAEAADTTTIGHAVFAQFIPDSVYNKTINPGKKINIRPIGRIQKSKDKEIYLLAAITQNKRTHLGVFVLNKKYQFLAGKLFLQTAEADGYVHSVAINKEPTFLVGKEKTNNDTKQLQFTHIGWIYNDAGAFMVVVNDSNEDLKKASIIINPVDTMPRKNKLSADYTAGKRNFISIRDGKNANTYRFFVHFEKKDGTCTGELKGELKMKDATSGSYNQSGDACGIDFTFNGNEVSLKELGGCGNHRGMDCLFDDTFTRKKEVKPAVKKKK